MTQKQHLRQADRSVMTLCGRRAGMSIPLKVDGTSPVGESDSCKTCARIAKGLK